MDRDEAKARLLAARSRKQRILDELLNKEKIGIEVTKEMLDAMIEHFGVAGEKAPKADRSITVHFKIRKDGEARDVRHPDDALLEAYKAEAKENEDG